MNIGSNACGTFVVVGFGLVAACGGPSGADTPGDGGAQPASEAGAPPSSGDGSVPSLGGDGSMDGAAGTVTPVEPTGPVTDFPAPILDGTAPADSATLFGPPSRGASTGGPCLVEPASDVVFPQNWLRPRFAWRASNGEDLFELRLHVGNQLQDLVVYTTATTWTMPKAAWDALRAHSPTEPMTLSIRGGTLAGGALQGEALGTSTPMGIAPVPATGSIVYWTTNDAQTGGSSLKGFTAGDESVAEVLDAAQFAGAQKTSSACIGCHTATPDGSFVALTTTSGAQQQWTDALALVDPDAGAVGTAPSYAAPAGVQALARPNVGAATFSPAHWKAGDRRAVVSYDVNGAGTSVVLSWVDLEATTAASASGALARNGDTQLAGAPAWSHDGQTVAYVSTNRVCTGRLGNCTPQYASPQDPGSRADLFTVPYAGGAGGTAVPVAGASDPSLQEYYPSFSPDDRWIVFNRAPDDANLYDQPAAELFVVPAGGGAAVRLAANDPAACSGEQSPGITNSWGKWGPTALQAHGKTYYWVVFSSRRGSSVPQLYIAAIVAAADGSLTTHGAIHLWNQPAAEANHTPAWDTFKVPPVTAQ
jgi:hypothetical protein